MAYRVGAGSACQAAKQNAWGTPVVPDTLINMTGESINVTVEKGDEGNLLASKTANQRDTMSMTVAGSINTSSDLSLQMAFRVCLGIKSGNVYTLANPNAELPVSTFVLSRGGIVKTYPDVS